MTFSDFLGAMGVCCLLALVNGQYQVKDLEGCTLEDGSYGRYHKPHTYLNELYVQCDTAQTRTVRKCPQGLLFDPKPQICNYPNVVNNTNWPCNQNLVGELYPGTCNDVYYRCNGAGYERGNCPSGQYFNVANRQCTGAPVADNEECIRWGRVAVDPRTNCTLTPDTANPCNYKTRINGIESGPYPCGEGTQFDANNCTCVMSSICYRSNNSINKVPDPQCFASYKVDFVTVTRNVPQVLSEKYGNGDRPIPDYILSSGAEFANGQATLTFNSQSAIQPFIYAYSFSNNQLGMNILISIILRSTLLQNNFEVISNNYEGQCTPTLEVKGVYNVNGYTVTVFVRGSNLKSVADEGTISATLSATINAQTNDFIEVRLEYDGHARLYLQNKGSTGTGSSAIINSEPSAYLGVGLAFNHCGFRMGRGLNGNIKKIVFRESCSDLAKGRTM